MKQLLVRVWRPLLEKFNQTAERACLRRDAYLNHILAHEARRLKEEIPHPNSDVAHAYLKRAVEGLDRTPVNFSLDPATIDLMNNACKELNVVRDCFVHRVLFLLTADVKKCEAAIGIPIQDLLPEVLWAHPERDYVYAPLWAGSMHAIAEIVEADPFWAIRNFIDHLRETEDPIEPLLHARPIVPWSFSKQPPEAIALNCYIPDELVPDSPASKQSLEFLLGEPTPIGNSKSSHRRKKGKTS